MNLEKEFCETINEINKKMIQNTNSSVSLVNNIIKQLITAGGKRLRGILVVKAGKAGNYEQNNLYNIAAALEILHLATLIHDDVIDEAELRRGQKAVQKKYNKDLAVLCGDFLYNRSFRHFSQNLSKQSLNKLHKIEKLICEGEAKQYYNKYNFEISIYDYLRRIRRKTALLFAFSTYVGAYESGITDINLNHFYNIGLNLGIAYQIRDDILDYTGSIKNIGKDTRQDLAAGILTLPLILLLQKDQYKKKIKKIIKRDQQNITAKDLSKIIIMIKEANCLEKSINYYNRFVSKSYTHLQSLKKNFEVADIENIIERLINNKPQTKLEYSAISL